MIVMSPSGFNSQVAYEPVNPANSSPLGNDATTKAQDALRAYLAQQAGIPTPDQLGTQVSTQVGTLASSWGPVIGIFLVGLVLVAIGAKTLVEA